MTDFAMSDNSRDLFVRVSSLFNLSLRGLAYNIKQHEEDITYLPPNIKSKLLYLLTKRGLLNDSNIHQCLHASLKELDLSECEVTDKGLEAIAETCKHLFKMDLNSAKSSRDTITDKGLIKVASECKFIQTLYLRRCLRIGDDSVIEIARCCLNLMHLNLGGCPNVTDQSLIALAQNCSILESVNVTSTKISDVGVIEISKGRCNKTLREFHMAKCNSISDESIEALIEHCEKIQILIFHGCPKVTDSSRIALEQLLARNSIPVKQLTWTIY